jgi:hypothetical protein
MVLHYDYYIYCAKANYINIINALIKTNLGFHETCASNCMNAHTIHHWLNEQLAYLDVFVSILRREQSLSIATLGVFVCY